MKKLLITAVFSFIFAALAITPIRAISIPVEALTIFENSAAENQNEELYKNLFIALIYTHVENAIDDYYREYMTYMPREDPWSYKFLSVEKIPNHNYSYIVMLEVQPYVGPHISVGLDHITFKIDTNGIVKEKFEHLKSYKLPPNYKDIIKKELPDV